MALRGCNIRGSILLPLRNKTITTMKKLFSLFVLAASVTMISCGGEQAAEETSTDTTVTVQEPVCTYSYIADSTRVKWTAYKFTEKAGVNGQFDSLSVEGTSTSEDPKAVLAGATFQVFVSSVETMDKGRNEKIVQHVFGTMMNTDVITGSIKGFSEDGNIVTMVIKMNDVEKEIEAPATWDGERVSVKTDINLEDFNAGASVEAIKNACKANHTGADGVAKVWPDVTIMLTTYLGKSCE